MVASSYLKASSLTKCILDDTVKSPVESRKGIVFDVAIIELSCPSNLSESAAFPVVDKKYAESCPSNLSESTAVAFIPRYVVSWLCIAVAKYTESCPSNKSESSAFAFIPKNLRSHSDLLYVSSETPK